MKNQGELLKARGMCMGLRDIGTFCKHSPYERMSMSDLMSVFYSSSSTHLIIEL